MGTYYLSKKSINQPNLCIEKDITFDYRMPIVINIK